MENNEDIIVGISTGFTEGAISIVRLSGFGSIELVNKIFKGCDLTKKDSHTIHYGFIVDDKEVLDEVLVSIYKAPKTYTKEDVVEINCHGGLFVTNKIYELLLLNGARSATPGEFTKRAFLNGRIDLTKAEAVMDMIQAENNSALSIASNALRGKIKEKIDALRNRIVEIISIISVNIDYPEYDDVEELTANKIKPEVLDIKQAIDELINKSANAKILKNGINTVIVGKPNVGKSSLLNSIIEENKAIVTEIPGTTRDTIEAKINLGSITLNLIDTAGVHKTNDVVEKIGIEKSIDALEKAELVLMVLSGNQDLSNEDVELIEKIKDKKYIIIVNKKDLGIKIDISNLKNCVVISTFDSTDIENLKNKILEVCEIEKLQNKDITYISNARQIEKLELASNALKEALSEINEDAYIDFIEIQLRAAWLYLGEIIGEASTDNLLDELFSRFCLGK